MKQYNDITKQAIFDWQNKLKEYTNNYDAWNINYNFIQNDHTNNATDDVSSLNCNIFIDFVDVIINSNDEIIIANGMTWELVSGEPLIEISTYRELSQTQFVSTITHELGHAFGLGEYITNEPELIEKWDQGIDLPSIMIKHAVSKGVKKITELDLEKMVSIYGNDGFDKLIPIIPE